MPMDYKATLQRAAEKFRASAALAAAEGLIPYKSENGRWIPSPYDGNSWWTGGFWPGLMWQFYAATGDEAFLREARRTEELLTAEFRRFTYLNHDVGFMYLLSCGADWKLTGDAQAHTDTLHAASLLMGRFSPVGYIRAWNGFEQRGYAIIDCMMNLSLLFWASRQTKDPRFAKVATIHADTCAREFIRENGSVSHIIEFDPETGARVQEHAGQGYCLGSSWSRGQAWGLYGFTLAHLNTHEPPLPCRRGEDCRILHGTHPSRWTDGLRLLPAAGGGAPGQHRRRCGCLWPAGTGQAHRQSNLS